MRAIKNGDTDKNEIADQCWKEIHQMNWGNKKAIDREINVYAVSNVYIIK